MNLLFPETGLQDFTLLETGLGCALVAVAVGLLFFRRLRSKRRQYEPVFDHLLRRIHHRRTEIFSNHRCPWRTMATREQLLAETRMRLRQEKSFFRDQEEHRVAAFTLIELLMIIATVVVLAATLIAAVARAREKPILSVATAISNKSG